MKAVAALVLVLTLGSGPGLAQGKAAWPLPTVQLPPQLDRVLRDYETAWRAGDGARLADVFTADGFVLSNGRLPRRGRADIQASIRGPGGPLELVAFSFATSDTVGYIVGGYRYPSTTGPGGKFVLALRRDQGGVWRIAADIENAGDAP